MLVGPKCCSQNEETLSRDLHHNLSKYSIRLGHVLWPLKGSRLFTCNRILGNAASHGMTRHSAVTCCGPLDSPFWAALRESQPFSYLKSLPSDLWQAVPSSVASFRGAPVISTGSLGKNRAEQKTTTPSTWTKRPWIAAQSSGSARKARTPQRRGRPPSTFRR